MSTSPTPQALRESLGHELRGARKRAGLTQEEAGERAGLRKNTILDYEYGRTSPQVETIYLLADIYGVPALELYQHAERMAGYLPVHVEADAEKRARDAARSRKEREARASERRTGSPAGDRKAD